MVLLYDEHARCRRSRHGPINESTILTAKAASNRGLIFLEGAAGSLVLGRWSFAFSALQMQASSFQRVSKMIRANDQ